MPMRVGEDDSGPSAKETVLPLQKDLLKARILLVSEVVSDKLARSVIAQALLMEAKDPDALISVFVNSPGGSADSGFAIYDTLRFVKPPIRTICSGLCASAAVIIYLAAEKAERFSLPNSRFLIHQPSTVSRGDASDIEITAKEIIRLKNRYNQIVAAETGKLLEKITGDADRDFWLNAEEAKAYGLVSRVVENRSEIEL